MKTDFLSHVAILGAFGKMGSGIATLILSAMAEQELSLKGSIGSYRLYLIDINDSAYSEILSKFRKHLTQQGEKSIQLLRQAYSKRLDLVENHEIIEEFVNHSISCLRVVTDVSTIKKCNLVFEAASENIEIKIKLFSALKENCAPTPYFLTNTSSIPISILEEKAGLSNRIIGYHFYNPPPKQKLVELVVPQNTEPELKEIANTVTKLLKKTTVASNDIAGFIGNGHFMREIIYAGSFIQKGLLDLPVFDAITRDLLCRPMGIFQLIDYVGLDVCQAILKVMSQYTHTNLHCPLIDVMLSLGIKGGQNADGSQKNGFFQYEKNKLAGYYALSQKAYLPSTFFDIKKTLFHIYPESKTWKEIIGQTEEEKKYYFQNYFKALFNSNDAYAKTAVAYLQESKRIAEQLVKDKVAQQADDVNKVLQLGFQHAYGPISSFF